MNEPPNATAILDQMFVNYDKRLRPMYGVEPVQLYISMGFLSISHIVEEDMVVRSTIYFFNVDLQIPYETKPGLIVSRNELEILNTKLMKGTFFVEEIENKVRPSVSKHSSALVIRRSRVRILLSITASWFAGLLF